MNSRVDASRSMKRADRAVAAGAPAQRRHEMRIRQAAHVEHQIGVDRHAVLEAEAEQRDRRAAARDRSRDSPMKNCRSSWTVMSDVSTISSAMLADRVQARALVADALRSPTDPGASGCGRRVSLNRRTSAALLASRKISTGLSRGIFRSRRKIFGNDDRKFPSRTSTTMATFSMSPPPRSDSFASVGISVVGRLSTQK